MGLQDMLAGTDQLGEDVVVARFNNGFEVAYERQLERGVLVTQTADGRKEEVQGGTVVRYALLDHRELPGGHNAKDLETHDYAGFSRDAERMINTYIKTAGTAMKREFDQRTARSHELYERITAPLEVEQYQHRRWGEYAGAWGMVLAWPVLLPMTLARPSGGSGDLGILLMPLLIPHLIKELFIPHEFLERSSRVKNKKQLVRENDGTRVAVEFRYGGESPRDFAALDLIFPEGLTLTHYGLFKSQNQEHIQGKYRDAKFFMDVDDTTREGVRSLHHEQEDMWDRWREFQKFLGASDQKTLLQRAGFLE